MRELVVTTQRTSKKYKAGVLAAWGLLVAGLVGAMAGAVNFGTATIALSVATWTTSKALAWWHHG